MAETVATTLWLSDGRKFKQIVIRMVILAGCLVVLATRRPDTVLNPQFWAEDGAIWYADAFNLGLIRPFFSPWTGYFQTLSRLTAAVSMILPIHCAPALFTSVALLVQILPVMLITSSRMAPVIPDLRLRYLLAAIYLSLPNSFEIHANLTCAYWHLGLSMMLVILAPVWATRRMLVADCLLVSLASLSGPLSILALPSAWTRWFVRRERRFLPVLWIVTAGAVIQVLALLGTAGSRDQIPNNPTLANIVRIFGGQIVTAALLGERGFRAILGMDLQICVLLPAMFVGLAVFVVALWRGPFELKLFMAFTGCVFIASLVSSMGNSPTDAWSSMTIPGMAGRYWFFPMLGFLTGLIWMAGSSVVRRSARFSARIIVVVLPLGILTDWQYPPMRDAHFTRELQRLEKARVGEVVDIPLNPPPFHMLLVKKAKHSARNLRNNKYELIKKQSDSTTN